MKMKIITSAFLAMSLMACSEKSNINKDSDIESRVESLLSQMTMEEKLGQMNQLSPWDFEELAARVRKGEVGSILNVVNPEEINKIQKIAVEESRLGIPILVSRDVIHGYKTIFPIPLAATFNPQIAEDGARVAAIEASADGIRWTFAPMIDISRDPRWGRIAESCGEDPYLSSVMGAAMIKGYQGDSLNDPTAIAACAKHFVAYGGVPSTANKFVLKDVLRDEWKYDGMVVTDWASAAEMINHGFCVDGKDAAEKSVNAGVDMEMVSETFIKNLKQSVEEKKVSMETIDNAVRNILRLKFRLGLFENPYVVTPQTVKYADAHLQIAKTAAEQSVILLKNDAQTLPFTDKVKTVAVVGPMADAPYEQMGTWVFDGEKEHTQTPLKAIREMYGDKVNVIFEQGLAYSRDKNVAGIAKAVNAARRADVVVCFVGEESILSGEAHSLANLDLQGAQSQLIKSLAATGKPVVTVVMAGRQLTISDEVEVSDAVLYSFHPGTMGGPAIADILFGKVNPSGKTPVTFPRMTGQAPIYYAHNNTGRPANPTEMLIDEIPVEAGQTSVGCRSFYLDAGNSPLFPFGYGLSYTNFEYSDLKLASDKLTVDGEVNVSVNLKNAGKYDGTEVVQLYVQDKVGSVTRLYVQDKVGSVIRPVKELKAFQRVELKAGESKTVTFTLPVSDLAFWLPVSDLAFWRYDMTYGVEPGDFKLWVGTNSAEGLSADFTVID